MSAQKFKSKSIVVEAIKYDGFGMNSKQAEQFVGRELKYELETEAAYEAGAAPPVFSVIIDTKEGPMKAMPGDYIVKEPLPTGDRDFYPVKAEIFKLRYYPAEEL